LRTGQLPLFPGQLASKKISEPPGPPKLVLLMSPVPVADDSGDLAGAIERIRKGDERYRLIQFDVKNGAIYLHGTAKPENVMAFARALSNVPGVERVVVRNQANR
jgi:hypothetical protein